MQKCFLLTLILIASLILVPMWIWSAFDLEQTSWGRWMGIPIFVALIGGGYLLWNLILRDLFGDD